MLTSSKGDVTALLSLWTTVVVDSVNDTRLFFFFAGVETAARVTVRFVKS